MPFGRVLGTIGSMIPETETIFEADLLAKQHPELILEQAREVLMLRSLHVARTSSHETESCTSMIRKFVRRRSRR
jgi:hypothetical protein